MYNDAGVNIHIHKMGFGQSDEEIEFSFLVAKALGCIGVTTERNAILAARVAPFADKHKIWVGFHNHTNNLPVMDKRDPILDLGQYIGFNLDIGHYVAGTKGKSPIPVLEKYHDRIVSLHLKDRTADGGNARSTAPRAPWPVRPARSRPLMPARAGTQTGRRWRAQGPEPVVPRPWMDGPRRRALSVTAAEPGSAATPLRGVAAGRRSRQADHPG